DSIRWEGDNSWLLLALTFYKEKTGTTNYDHMARAIADWLVDLQDRPGAELSEQNDYGLWYGFDFAGTNFVHTKCIEGNLDAWAALAPYPDKAEARAKLRDYILSKYHPDERRLQLGGDWEIIDSETVAWSCACGIAPDLLALDYATNHIVRVTSEITGLELEGFAFMPDDAKAGRLEIAPTIEIASAYQALGKPDEANRWMREIDKTVIESSVYPGTKGFAFVANKTRWPNDPADLRRISPHACSWYIFVCEGFNPFMIGR
ncbi:MAG: hypothetical protein JW889_06955, partial [Verrucomicrobia bacterium]|nr:hypothetical protein [Verrucomicrobiota bacterium]